MNAFKPFQINLFLCLVMVGIGIWSYEASNHDMHTLIVPILGILLSLFHAPLKRGNEKAVKWTFFTTVLILVIMLLPLKNTIEAHHYGGLLRVSLILVSCILVLLYYWKHFKNSITH